MCRLRSTPGFHARVTLLGASHCFLLPREQPALDFGEEYPAAAAGAAEIVDTAAVEAGVAATEAELAIPVEAEASTGPG